MKDTSYSRVEAWATCRKRFDLAYNKGLRVISPSTSPQTQGDLFHQLMETALRLTYDFQTMNAPLDLHEVRHAVQAKASSWVEAHVGVPLPDDLDGEEKFKRWDDIAADVQLVVMRTIKNLNIPLNYTIADIEGEPLIEYDIEYAIPDTDLRFLGRIDLVMIDKHTGGYVLFDWKFTGSFKDFSYEALNSQLALYTYILVQLGIGTVEYPAQATLYQVKNRPPAIPNINKDGTISRRVSTDWETYLAFIVANGLNPADYYDMAAKLSGYEYFKPVTLMRGYAMLERVWNNFVTKSQEMYADETHSAAYGYACRFCSFAEWCTVQLEGGDPEILIDDIYERKVFNAPTNPV